MHMVAGVGGMQGCVNNGVMPGEVSAGSSQVKRAIWTSLKPRCFTCSMSSVLMSFNCCVFSQLSAYE